MALYNLLKQFQLFSNNLNGSSSPKINEVITHSPLSNKLIQRILSRKGLSALVLFILLYKYYSHRTRQDHVLHQLRWIQGLLTTIHSVSSHLLSSSLTFHKRIFINDDGEESVIYFYKRLPPVLYKSSNNDQVCDTDNNNKNNDNIEYWMILPGGMTSGDAFYTRQFLNLNFNSNNTTYSHSKGANSQNKEMYFFVFHNPGIINKMKKTFPPSLTDPKYVIEFIKLIKNGFYLTETHIHPVSQLHSIAYSTIPSLNQNNLSLIGFSAGSMLAMSSVIAIDEYNRSISEETNKNTNDIIQSNSNNKNKLLLRACIAVHGPDRIRSVFEFHEKTWCRLDILFAASLFKTMISNHSSVICDHIPPIHTQVYSLFPPWMQGWRWMKNFTETVFQSQWNHMEDKHWCIRKKLIFRRECMISNESESIISGESTKQIMRNGSHHSLNQIPSDKINTCLNNNLTPLLRILSLNDPIVDLNAATDSELYNCVDRIIIQNNGGHCAAFGQQEVCEQTIAWWNNTQ